MWKLVGNRCCASFSYYDANEAMAEAFKNLFGFEVDTMNETHSSIWSKAWISAQDGEFWYNSFTAIRQDEIGNPSDEKIRSYFETEANNKIYINRQSK